MQKIRRIILMTLCFFSHSLYAYDAKCFKQQVDRFNYCHRNALDKAERGNFKALRSKECEKRLGETVGECFGTKDITPCERKVGEFFINCQSRENQKFMRGNLKARSASRCIKEFEDQMVACEVTEQKNQ